LYAENKEAVKEEVAPAVVTDANEAPAVETHAKEAHTTDAKGEVHAAAHDGNKAHAAHGEEHGHDDAVKNYAGFGLVEILIFIGFAGAFLFMFFFELAKHPLLNEKDPYFQESLKHNI